MKEIQWDKKPISKAGLYAGVPMEHYHGQLTTAPSVSSSGLRTIWAKSPRHYWWDSYLNPDRPVEVDRPHFAIGRAAHHLLLQGRKGFDAEFVVRPSQWSDWRTKEARAWRDEMLMLGKTIITLTELEHIKGMAQSLAAEPLVRAGILDGLVERSLVYPDPETGVWVKARPDAVPNDTGDYSDLKTTTDVSDESISRTITDFGYNQQGALVRSASLHTLQTVMRDFILVFVEKQPPYCVRVVPIPVEDLDRGESQNRIALHKFKAGVETGDWPGPGAEAAEEYRGLQPYARIKIDKRLEVEIPALESAIYEGSA
jgi:hypothetical protein